MKADPKTARIAWDGHMNKCARCQAYVDGSPATLAYVCPTGAPLIKDVLEVEQAPLLRKKRKAERDVYKAAMQINAEQGPTTKKKAEAAMRFK